ncbi:hypothetical protein BU17DRAFT_66015 [Hysterangium stoloniferum]|nr:hypothetical protein BU17DRAFT_66015 [Hysterangium stoloniferum]
MPKKISALKTSSVNGGAAGMASVLMVGSIHGSGGYGIGSWQSNIVPEVQLACERGVCSRSAQVVCFSLGIGKGHGVWMPWGKGSVGGKNGGGVVADEFTGSGSGGCSYNGSNNSTVMICSVDVISEMVVQYGCFIGIISETAMCYSRVIGIWDGSWHDCVIGVVGGIGGTAMWYSWVIGDISGMAMWYGFCYQ